MNYLKFTSLLTLSIILTSGCTRQKEVPFAKKKNLLGYLKERNATPKGDVLLFILQTECSCTIDHVILTDDILSSPKYSNILKIVVVPDSTHSVFKKARVAHFKNVRFIVDQDQGLRRAGIVMSVDRIFFFKDTSITKLTDMHLTKDKELRKEYL